MSKESNEARATVRPSLGYFERVSRILDQAPTVVGALLSVLVSCASCGSPPAPAAAQQGKAPASNSVSSAALPAERPKFGTFGFDVAGMDRSVKPGDDFHAYANGRWIRANSIPPDRADWGTFEAGAEASIANVRSVIEEQVRAKNAHGTNAQRLADAYTAYLDVSAIDAKGLAPAKPYLDAIDAAKSLSDVVKLMGRADLPSNAPFSTFVWIDTKNTDRFVVFVEQSGLELPDRDFYLKKDAQFQETRKKYQANIAKVLAFAGDVNASSNASAIVALETQIAELHWPVADRRNRDTTYNPRTVAELEKEAPGFPWRAYLDALGYGEAPLVVKELSAMPKLARLFAATPVAKWKAYLEYHFLVNQAEVLPSALEAEVFDFYGKTLGGKSQQAERWKRGVAMINDGALGDAAGELYVARFFKASAKAETERLVENLRKAFAGRIQGVDWMTPETKRAAHEKLAAVRTKIGYPDKWKDYSALDIVPGDAFGNSLRASVWEQAEQRARLGKPSDRAAWYTTPQRVVAYNNPPFNEILFTAAILQPPFFDPNADAAVNYGAIGGVIGHELGHGFDDQGAKLDARGVLRPWWSKGDVDAFKARTDALAAQYDTFEPLPGLKVNGRLTLGENIGDLGGLTIAYTAYKLALDGKPAPVLDGLTGDQRFFLGWAQIHRSLQHDEALRNQIMSDPHSPAKYGVNGVVRNMDAWYSAFDIKPGDALYLAPNERVHIW
ncbi:MAG TPA: M13 family metallopeptidase [Polyangiaceae bacterium]|nr:M13 family metallopeptidase [Polyangiaceae bacterium]